MVKCDNDECDFSKNGLCTTDPVLEKTWAGSTYDWRLRCETALKKGKPFKYHK